MEKGQKNTGMDRRSFLRQAAMAGSALCLAPALGRAEAAGRMIMDEPQCDRP